MAFRRLKFYADISTPAINTRSSELEKFEPENKKKNWSNYLRQVLMVTSGLVLGIYVVIQNINKFGTLKQESSEIVKETVLDLKFNQKLMNIHHFTYMQRFEIQNRMECIKYHKPKPCFEYCSLLHFHRNPPPFNDGGFFLPDQWYFFLMNPNEFSYLFNKDYLIVMSWLMWPCMAENVPGIYYNETLDYMTGIIDEQAEQNHE